MARGATTGVGAAVVEAALTLGVDAATGAAAVACGGAFITAGAGVGAWSFWPFDCDVA